MNSTFSTYSLLRGEFLTTKLLKKNISTFCMLVRWITIFYVIKIIYNLNDDIFFFEFLGSFY
jgi:hypothetical protein